MKEIWKDVVGYKGLYQVSNLGKIKSLERTVCKKAPRIVKERVLAIGKLISYKNCPPYGVVSLWKNNKGKSFRVNRLVALTFNNIDYNTKLEVNHIDFNTLNNNLDNLEIVTPKENVRHSIKNNRYRYRKVNVYLENQVKTFRNMAELSLFLGFSQYYISDLLRKNKNTINYNGKIVKIERQVL
jgi:hypothetical protein